MRTLMIVMPALALAACGSAQSNPGPSGTRSFDLNGFDQVKLAGSDDVRVVAGSAFSVQATGPEKTLEKLDISVRGSTLNVGRKSKSWSMGWNNDPGAVVTVTMPIIKSASLAGSGDFSIDQVDTPSFEASIAGSGNMDVKSAKLEKLSINLAGSGDIDIAGTSKTIDISLAGSGNVKAGSMNSEQASISVAGSGNVDARATVSATVNMVGSGDVTIAGTSNCKTSKLGSGDVRCTP
jgi:hypothetical protein